MAHITLETLKETVRTATNSTDIILARSCLNNYLRSRGGTSVTLDAISFEITELINKKEVEILKTI